MSSHCHFEFDMLTEDGLLIAEAIPCRADLRQDENNALLLSNVDIEVTAQNSQRWGYAGGKTSWRPLPRDLRPYLDRWADTSDAQDWLLEKIKESGISK